MKLMVTGCMFAAFRFGAAPLLGMFHRRHSVRRLNLTPDAIVGYYSVQGRHLPERAVDYATPPDQRKAPWCAPGGP